jgi:rsbT co-antagonist protein RsbR
MPSTVDLTSTQLLMRDMGLDERSLENRRKLAGIEADDLRRIASLRELVESNVDTYVNAFMAYLSRLDEAAGLFSNKVLTERARRLKAEHLLSMVRGTYGVEYVTQRIELGLLYSRAGLELPAFLGAFHHMLQSLGAAVLEGAGLEPARALQSYISLEKVAFMDVGIIVDVLVFERQRVIRQQQDAIRELSTPVLQIRDRLLLLPIIGVIDTHRARLITESLLATIRQTRAKVVVMDITGVATIDSKVANHMLQTVSAARLMGALVIVTGLSADVAQSLVALGIDLGKLKTIGDLQGGLEEAELLLGGRGTSAPHDTSRQLSS